MIQWWDGVLAYTTDHIFLSSLAPAFFLMIECTKASVVKEDIHFCIYSVDKSTDSPINVDISDVCVDLFEFSK